MSERELERKLPGVITRRARRERMKAMRQKQLDRIHRELDAAAVEHHQKGRE